MGWAKRTDCDGDFRPLILHAATGMAEDDCPQLVSSVNPMQLTHKAQLLQHTKTTQLFVVVVAVVLLVVGVVLPLLLLPLVVIVAVVVRAQDHNTRLCLILLRRNNSTVNIHSAKSRALIPTLPDWKPGQRWETFVFSSYYPELIIISHYFWLRSVCTHCYMRASVSVWVCNLR